MAGWPFAAIESVRIEMHIKKDSNEISSDSDLFDDQLPLAQGL